VGCGWVGSERGDFLTELTEFRTNLRKEEREEERERGKSFKHE
jgi:hypothetical protein